MRRIGVAGPAAIEGVGHGLAQLVMQDELAPALPKRPAGGRQFIRRNPIDVRGRVTRCGHNQRIREVLGRQIRERFRRCAS